MTPRPTLACGVLFAAVVSVAASQVPFRSERTVVSVVVSVRSGNAPVTALTAADFRLTDNGHGQRIDAVSMEKLPIDLTLAIDTSGSTATGVGRLVAEAASLARRLRASDRFRLLSIDTMVHEVLPLRSAAEQIWPARIPFNGASAVHDALFAGLVTPVDADRRHLFIALTDGVDTISALDAGAVRDAAERSDVLLHIVTVTFAAAPPPVPPNWLPRRDADLEVLREAARRTGGDMHAGGQLGPDSLRAVTAALEDFRSSYVLRYSPTDAAPGWHALEVRLNRREPWTVRARRGYFR
ncbi:MAG TPA: VWA domain-containing protein [Vicinamibacterales bacterium]|nr:VWA domain-containing protein [Vicinamibacterales bacterium]